MDENKAKSGPAKTGLVNISDVAQMAGVSVSTVSRALNGSSQISRKTRERVEHVAQLLGYVPNGNAKALTTASNAVTVIERVISGGTYEEIVTGAEEEASAHGMSFQLITPSDKDARFNGIIRQLQEQRPRVAILLSSGLDEHIWDEQVAEQVERLHQFGTELVVVGRSRKPMWGNIGVVDYDNEGGMHDMIAELIRLGHRRFLYYGKRLSSSVYHARYTGFMRALAEAGLSHDESMSIELAESQQDLERQLAELRDNGGLPFTAVASTDNTASDVLLALWRLGIAVPEQVSVCGFDDMYYSDRLLVPLTTVHVPFREMGHCAVRMGLGEIGKDVRLPVHTVMRESTAQVPKAL